MKVAIPGKGIIDVEEADKLGVLDGIVVTPRKVDKVSDYRPGPKEIRVICEVCHKSFYAYASDKRRFCSKECAGKYHTGSNNSMARPDVIAKHNAVVNSPEWIEKHAIASKDYYESMTGKTLEERWGEEKAAEAKRKLSENPVYQTPEFREKIRQTQTPERRKKQSETTKRLWAQLDFKLKWHEGVLTAPNRPEIYFNEFLDKFFPEQFVYLRDSDLKIGGRTPDFVHVSKKKVIEIFGNYWFNLIFFPDAWTPEELIEHYKTYGYECLVLWEDEVYNEEEKNKTKVQELLEGETSRCQMTQSNN